MFCFGGNENGTGAVTWKENHGGKNGRIAQKRGWMNNTQRKPHETEEMREKFWEKWESIYNFIRKS